VARNFGFWICDFGSEAVASERTEEGAVFTMNPKSKIQNLKSRRRPGVTILEVLFAIMVTAIGLMGAITLLPVAATQARKARTTDAATTAVTAAVGDFDTKGMRMPSRWIGWNQDWDLRASPPKPAASFRHLAEMSLPYGVSLCIDPRGIAANDQDNNTRRELSTFPYTAISAFPYDPITSPAPRMFRVTLSNSTLPVISLPSPMGKLIADNLFTFDDDLQYDRPSDQSIVGLQRFEFLPAATTTVGRRQIEGNLSWMATLVPKLDRYSLSQSNEYVLSIVVFHGRPANMGRNPDTNNSPLLLDPKNERVLTIPSPGGMPGGGILGGEVLLQTPAATQEDADELLDVHTNDWIMLSGQAQHAVPWPSGQVRRINIFKWYRVSDIEFEVTWNGTVGERWVTLAGQDWDTNLANIEAVAVEGVVAVVEKTVRLELGP
jgi:hypothetical protein